jgi:hypothetical protein
MYETPYTFSEIMADTLEKLRQPALNYNRYSEPNIKRAINASQLEMVSRVKNLHSFAIMILKVNYGLYAAPSDMITPKKAFFYQSPTSYYEVPIKTKEWLDQYLSGWRQLTGSQPSYLFPADSDGWKRRLGITPIPTVAGDNYLVSPDTGVVVSATGMTTSGNITGLNNAASATICTDSLARTLSTLGAQVGMMAVNVTDGSKGQISAVTGATITAALTGGTANTWAIGDSFMILAGEYGVVTGLSSTEEQYVFNTEVGELANISALTNNIYMEYYRRPLLLQYPAQYPEAPFELHEFISDGAVWRLKRTATKGSDDANSAVISKQIFDQAIQKYTGLDEAIDDSGMSQNW